jgi:hypothetical protein
MRIKSLVDLIRDSGDILDFFEGVDSVEQMISKLERIKKTEPEEFFANVMGLRITHAAILEDTFEFQSSGTDDELEGDLLDDDDEDDIEEPLEGIGDDAEVKQEDEPEKTDPKKNTDS